MCLKCKTVNWEKVNEKVSRESWASGIANSLQKGFENHLKAWPGDPPLERSEWYHYYFCSACAGRLKFDIDKPREHICPNCGQIYYGQFYDGAWRKFVHGAIVTNLERAAILANIHSDNKDYCDYIRKNILFYTENYNQYEVHGNHAGKGKVFPQSLTEAIFIIAIERTLRFVSKFDLFSNEELDKIGEKFFQPAVELLKPQITMIHNIHAWMHGAIAAAANFLGDKELLNFSINSEFGWINQVRKGVTDEGIWYEISPGYHFYTISALLSTAWIALENGINLFTEPKFKKMAVIINEIAYETGELPAYNDCGFGINISDYDSIYEQFSSMNDGEDISRILSRIYDNELRKPCETLHSLPNFYETPATSHSRSSVSALLYGISSLPEAAQVKKASNVFESTGLGILQDEKLRVTLKFTPNCGGHDHNDKLSIDIFSKGELISYDPGTSGYGIALTNKWNRTSLAHNMVVINGKKQKPGIGKLISYNDKQITAYAGEAYDDTELERTLILNKNGFEDLFNVKCKNEAIIDWVFHCKGKFEFELPFAESNNFSEENGYDQVRSLKKAVVNDDWNIKWLMEDKELQLNFKGEMNTEVFIGRCWSSIPLEDLGIVIVRRRAKSTCFKCCFEL